jgi:hypothetical protein
MKTQFTGDQIGIGKEFQKMRAKPAGSCVSALDAFEQAGQNPLLFVLRHAAGISVI